MVYISHGRQKEKTLYGTDGGRGRWRSSAHSQKPIQLLTWTAENMRSTKTLKLGNLLPSSSETGNWWASGVDEKRWDDDKDNLAKTQSDDDDDKDDAVYDEDDDDDDGCECDEGIDDDSDLSIWIHN